MSSFTKTATFNWKNKRGFQTFLSLMPRTLKRNLGKQITLTARRNENRLGVRRVGRARTSKKTQNVIQGMKIEPKFTKKDTQQIPRFQSMRCILMAERSSNLISCWYNHSSMPPKTTKPPFLRDNANKYDFTKLIPWLIMSSCLPKRWQWQASHIPTWLLQLPPPSSCQMTKKECQQFEK